MDFPETDTQLRAADNITNETPTPLEMGVVGWQPTRFIAATPRPTRLAQELGILSTWPTWILFGSLSLSLLASKIFM
jgi:hypothetical protein